jgi:predicted DCC family thiol-disulfide oxidoreductase YuxK
VRVNGPLVLFDGVCKFCNASVNFIIDHDRRARLRFAALQSDTGREVLRTFGLPADGFASLVLVEQGRCYTRSTAALRIARWLDAPWPLLSALVVVPAVLRDGAYELLARNRYAWFGKLDTCRVPTPELRRRFVE